MDMFAVVGANVEMVRGTAEKICRVRLIRFHCPGVASNQDGVTNEDMWCLQHQVAMVCNES